MDERHRQPASFSGGRYQVKRFLGEGGKKMVYLARDTQLDRDVAFALIKTHGLDDVSRTRLSREAFRAELHYELAVVAILENDPAKVTIRCWPYATRLLEAHRP